GRCGLAHDREALRTAVERLDGEPMLGEQSACRPTPQPRSSAVRAPRAFSSGKSAITSGSGSSQSARPSAVAHRLSQASIAVVNAVAITTLLPPRRLSAHPNPAPPPLPAAPRAELKALYYGHSRIRGVLVRNWALDAAGWLT